jgi:hypothetical protein
MMKQSSLFPVLYSAILNVTNTHFQTIFNLPFISDQSLSSSSSSSSACSSSSTPGTMSGYTSLSTIAETQWLSLNASVNGRLYNDGTPFARACFSNYDGDGSGANGADAQACQSIQTGYLSEQFRLPYFGSYTNVRLSQALSYHHFIFHFVIIFFHLFFPPVPVRGFCQAPMSPMRGTKDYNTNLSLLDAMGDLSSYGRWLSP